MERYSKDHGGLYPQSFLQLVPDYIENLPVCPVAKDDTYSRSLEVSNKEANFSFYCSGDHHLGVKLDEALEKTPADYPRYTGKEGLFLSPVDKRTLVVTPSPSPTSGGDTEISIVGFFGQDQEFVESQLGPAGEFITRSGPKDAVVGLADYTERGVEVQYWNGKVSSVTLHTEGGDWAGYSGVVPAGLSLDMTADQIVAQLGAPDERHSTSDGSLMNFTQLGINVTFHKDGSMNKLSFWKKPDQ